MPRARNTARDRRLIATFGAVLVLAAGTVSVHLASADPPNLPTIDRVVPIGEDHRLSIQFLGDTMLGDEAQPIIDQQGYDWPLADVAPMLDGDHVIADVEGPMTVITEPYDRAKEFSYLVNPAAAGALARAGVDSISLANSHAMDAGPIGLAQTMDNSAAAGLAVFGAGENLSRGEQPLLLRSDVGTVGVVALAENAGSAPRARADRPGVVVLSPATVQRGVDLARAAGADWVIAYVHWGDDYKQITDEQRYWAQMLVQAGYDMVVGAGPHIVQPIEYIGSVPIVYSLGNFVFGSQGQFEVYGVPGFGLMVSAEVSKKTAHLFVRCMVTDNDLVDYQTRRCSPEQAAALLPVYSRKMTVQGDTGVLSCSCFARKD
jgi:Bacterial capsule synthesis protein PGA_cap